MILRKSFYILVVAIILLIVAAVLTPQWLWMVMNVHGARYSYCGFDTRIRHKVWNTTERDYASIIKSSPISKDVVIHRVYFDDRNRDDHQNQTVFFIDVKWIILKKDWIIGCGVNNTTALDYRIHLTAQWWAYRKIGNKPYEHMLVYCYDLPVEGGDRAFLVYKKDEYSDHYTVESEFPVIIPKTSVASDSTYNISVLACVKANSKKAPFLGELLLYQKAVGVDHVSLTTLSTFIKDGGLQQLIIEYPNLFQYFLQGYISIDVWKEWYVEEKDIREFSESIRKVACMYNYRGTYDYAIPIDSDDFFTPRVSEKTNIKYYIKRFCHDYPVGSCMLKWIYYFPEFCGLSSIPENGNVTMALKSYKGEIAGIRAPKSIHKLQALIDASYHDARPRCTSGLMPGYEVAEMDPKFAYFAHNRMFAKPKSRQC